MIIFLQSRDKILSNNLRFKFLNLTKEIDKRKITKELRELSAGVAEMSGNINKLANYVGDLQQDSARNDAAITEITKQILELKKHHSDNGDGDDDGMDD